ncbi:MAG: RNA polymerase sigma-70 factor (ECF subfamily) [Verrucomicrobiales bacterium]
MSDFSDSLHPRLRLCDTFREFKRIRGWHPSQQVMTHFQQLERIYETYAELLFQYFRARTRSDDTARELLQDLFVKLGTRPDALSPEDQIQNERAWIFKVARNLVIDRVRRGETRQIKTQEYGAAATGQPIFADTPDPDLTQLREELSAALLELPEPQRVVVYLKLIAGLTFSDIASAEEISPNTAVSRYRYGIEKLQTKLRPVYNDMIKS